MLIKCLHSQLPKIKELRLFHLNIISIFEYILKLHLLYQKVINFIVSYSIGLIAIVK